MAGVASPSSRSPLDSFASSNPARRQYTRLKKKAQVRSLDEVWANLNNDQPTPLDKRFIDVKKRLVRPENYEAVQASWVRLLLALEERAKHIESIGSDYIPTVDYATIDSEGNFPKDATELIKSRGCCVVRGVVTRQQALDWKAEMISYVKRHPAVAGNPPPASDPQIWKVYWTKPQVEARSNPEVIKCQTAMSKLYSCSEDVEVDVTSQAMYADRFRVRYPGEAGTLPPHLDNGSIERWEDIEGSKTYQAIWDGRWEDYDAWDIDHRAEAVVDLYGGPGACSVFRSLQGWLSLADNGPRRGTLELCPDIRLTTAYILLRPFFDQYGKLDMESTYFYGADPGMGQVVKDSWHPALQMDKTIIPVPEAGPGDYVFWHCDMVHKVEEAHEGASDSSVAYIPVVPLTSYNIANLVEQRKAFLAGVPPPDMVSLEGEEEEREHDDRGRPEDILTVEGKRIMGLAPLDLEEKGITPGQFAIRTLANEALGFCNVSN